MEQYSDVDDDRGDNFEVTSKMLEECEDKSLKILKIVIKSLQQRLWKDMVERYCYF